MEKFIQVTDTGDTPHFVRIAAITRYTDAGGFGAHASVLFDNGQNLNVKETPSAITTLIADALAA